MPHLIFNDDISENLHYKSMRVIKWKYCPVIFWNPNDLKRVFLNEYFLRYSEEDLYHFISIWHLLRIEVSEKRLKLCLVTVQLWDIIGAQTGFKITFPF